NIVIIITDGLESCDGDPCAVSLALQTKRIFLKPFVIGLGMNKSFEEQFNCVGQFFDASNISAFRKVLNKTLKQTLDKTTVSVELLDINNQPKETDVNVTFLNNFTGQAAYEFVHYLDQSGRTDTVVVDAVLSYDVVVNTVPPVARRNVYLDGGAHNVIRIKAPQGNLAVQQKNQSEYGSPVKIIVRKRGKPQTITLSEMGRQEKLLVGRYDLEILTLPRIYRGSVSIEQSKTTNIEIPAPGVLNINSNVPGVGSLYQMQEDGGQKWIRNLSGNARETLAIQPGSYKLVFRANKAKGSKYTEIHNFTIKSGSTKTIKLFGI
ncbi:MAG: vWA domain-containing protein, partial [Cyclobacteriaceae bacterium]